MENLNSAPMRVEKFAEMVGTTPNNIRGHIKKYAAELEGHIEKKPKKGGTYLDEFAQNFIKGNMRTDPVQIDTARTMELLEENNKLLHQINELITEKTELQLAAAEHTKLIESHEDLKYQLQSATIELTQTSEKNIELQDSLKKAHNLIDSYEKGYKEQVAEMEQLQNDLAAAQSELENMKNRGFWKRLFNKE